jgi:hypothetical protein
MFFYSLLNITICWYIYIQFKNINDPQEVVQSAGTTPQEAEVTSSNPPPLLCGHVKKKKKNSKILMYFTLILYDTLLSYLFSFFFKTISQ